MAVSVPRLFSTYGRAIVVTLLGAVFSILICSPPVLAEEQIGAVEFHGNERIEADTAKLQVSSKAGDVFDRAEVENDVKQLYRTGFFDQVSARTERNADGGLLLIFQVKEKPAIRAVTLKGNEHVEDDTLSEKLNIIARRFLDPRKIKLGIEAAKAYYESKGYYGTEIGFTVEPVEKNEVDLTITVTEGKKKFIRKIVFEGLHGIDSDDLEDTIKTTTYAWWSSWITGSGIANKEQLENDVRELNKYYLNHGYVDVKIDEPLLEEGEEDLTLTFRIREGDVYRFGQLDAAGTLLEDDLTKTLAGIDSKTGDIFSVDALRKDTFTISEKFTDIGFAFANVEPDTHIRREDKEVDITFKVEKGRPVAINRIGITGNRKTADNVVRRSLVMNEQETYSSSKIKRSQELLRRLGYFDEVTISPEPAETEDRVNLNVAVKEASTGSFSVGAGVSSGEGFIATARVSENNIFGTGNTLAFDVSSGSERNNYVLSFDNPRVEDSLWSFGADLLSTEREYDDYDRKQQGGALSIGHPLTFLGDELKDDYRFTLRYELMNIDITDIDEDASQLVKDNEGESVSSSVTPRLVRNTIDNPLDPENGSRQVADIELAGLGGNEEFWLLGLANTFYYPMAETSFGNFVFSQRTRLDYGRTYDGDDFPLFKRFFPGGINSVRGYDSRSLGPVDDEGNEYGGSKQLILNFEMIVPVLKQIGLKGLVFYDAGQAFDDDVEIEIGELRQAAGFGIRWRSPLAPIRIEFGWPLDKEDGDKSFVTNFSFGAPL